MKELVELRESSDREIALSAADAAAISDLGKAMASKKVWFGGNARTKESPQRSIISCTPVTAATFNVRVDGAIGAFGVGNTQFTVTPKVRLDHCLYVMSRALALTPRLRKLLILLGKSYDLLELVAHWFIEAMHILLRGDLIRDYKSMTSEATALRGQLRLMATVSLYYSGSTNLVCTYDEFTQDNSYNRVLLAASRQIEGSGALRHELRRQARSIASHFDGVGELEPADVDVTLDRRSAHYADAITAAQLLLESSSLSLARGNRRAWSFLIKTPELIEDGVRSILQEGLGSDAVGRGYAALIPANWSVEPDLCFKPSGFVGDVKYKVDYGSNEWPRADLYQSVAFAVGCKTTKSCIISFSLGRDLPDIMFDDITVSDFRWDWSEASTPGEAAKKLVHRVRSWIEA